MSTRETVDDTRVNTPDPLFDIAGSELSFLVTDVVTARTTGGMRATCYGVVLETGVASDVSNAWAKAEERFKEDGTLLKKPALYFRGVPLAAIVLPGMPGDSLMPQYPVGRSWTLGELAVLMGEELATTCVQGAHSIVEAMCMGAEALLEQR